MKQRIWELDAFRGICILGVIAVHFVYDVTVLYRLVSWKIPAWFAFVQQWGGVAFLLLSGICVTLGSRSVKRGSVVFACGMLCTLVTWGMYRFGMAGKSIIIYFGVLHCLGVCMLLWPVFRRLPVWLLGILGAAFALLGLWFLSLPGLSHGYLTLLGLPRKGFQSSDYFPMLPYLGFFLLGSTMGKTLYCHRQTLLPKVNAQNPVLRFFRLCGKHSLWIYLLHQPLLSAVLYFLQ